MTLDPRLNPYRPDLAAAHLKGRVDAARFVEATVMRVAAGIAPVREEPRTDARLATEFLFGERVHVYEDRAGWAWCQSASDDYVGYVPRAHLAAPGGAPTHRVSVLHTFLYPAPDLKAPPVDMLPMMAEIAPTGGADNRFVQVADGGWVFADHLVTLDERAGDPVGVAESFTGLPYLWGGRTSRGIDCSGLLQIALRAAGYAAPRDTDMQAALGRAGDESGPRRRGDIVFFPGHVGLMCDAEHLIHANAWTMTVAIEPLADVIARLAEAHARPVTAIRQL